MKIHDQITVLDYNRNVTKESNESDVADFNIEFVDQMLEYWDNNITNIFRRQKDILVADSVLELFRRRKNIENFNKKALYIMIREMTGSNTQHITRVINQMKNYYFNMLEEFQKGGKIDTANTNRVMRQGHTVPTATVASSCVSPERTQTPTSQLKIMVF